MKLIKITFIVFIFTFILSSFNVFATQIWPFIGITVSSSSSNYPYQSSTHYKNTTSQQHFSLTDCKDQTFWLSRNLKVAINGINTYQTTSYKELESGETAYFSDAFTQIQNDFAVMMRIANPLVNSLYVTGTWYID